MRREDSIEKGLKLENTGGKLRRGRQRWLNGVTEAMNINLEGLQKLVEERGAWRAAVHGGHKESDTTEQLKNKPVQTG